MSRDKRNKNENVYNISENVLESSMSEVGNIQIYDSNTNKRIANKSKKRPPTENPRSAIRNGKCRTAAYGTASNYDTMDEFSSSKKTERTRLVEGKDLETVLTSSKEFYSDDVKFRSRVGRVVDMDSVRWDAPFTVNTFQEETGETCYNSCCTCCNTCCLRARNCCRNCYCSIS